jgi:hypothetical protein
LPPVASPALGHAKHDGRRKSRDRGFAEINEVTGNRAAPARCPI